MKVKILLSGSCILGVNRRPGISFSDAFVDLMVEELFDALTSDLVSRRRMFIDGILDAAVEAVAIMTKNSLIKPPAHFTFMSLAACIMACRTV